VTTIKRAVIYARVSTDEQADRGYSLPSQLDLMRAYAEQLGYRVVAELTEDFTGAKPIAERPEGKKLIAILKTGQADTIIAYQVDRLSRDIVDLLVTVRQWLRAGIEVHACDVGKIESELDIVLVIKGWQGSDERKKIRERSMRGKQAKAKAGKVVGSPVAPYGFRFERNEHGKAIALVIIEDEARVVRLIFQWYVHGDENEKPLSFGEIARKLTILGVTTPGKLRGMRFKRERAIWHTAVIAGIIRSEVYIGVWRFGVICGKNRRPDDEHIKVNVPAMIDRTLWEGAQARIEYNKQMAKRNCHREYLLRGLIRCGCGYSMGGHFKKHNQLRYYSCMWRNNYHERLEPRPCFEKMVKADAVELGVWDEIYKFFFDAEQFERSLRIAQQAELDTMVPQRDELESIEAMIAEAEHEAGQIGRALIDASGIVKKSLEKDMQPVNVRYEALTARRDELITKLGARRLTDDAIAALIQYRQDTIEGMKQSEASDKRRILEMLGVKVKVVGGQVWASCSLRPEPKPIELSSH
jgi:site-specific DNA recombinase